MCDNRSPGGEQGAGRRVTAFHEAGHAFVAHVYGRDFDTVSVDEDGAGGDIRVALSGYSRERLLKIVRRPSRVIAPPERLRFEEAIVIAVAGAATEAHLARVRVGAIEDADAAAVAQFLAFLRRPDDQEFVTRCCAKAATLVDGGWTAIEAIAAALLERGSLTKDEVSAVIALALAKLDLGED